MMQPDQEDRRMYNTLTIFALLIRCPAGNTGKDDNCPFAELRTLCELEEKFMLAESLTDEKCREFLGVHYNCLAGAGPTIEKSRLPYNPADAGGLMDQKCADYSIPL